MPDRPACLVMRMQVLGTTVFPLGARCARNSLSVVNPTRRLNPRRSCMTRSTSRPGARRGSLQLRSRADPRAAEHSVQVEALDGRLWPGHQRLTLSPPRTNRQRESRFPKARMGEHYGRRIRRCAPADVAPAVGSSRPAALYGDATRGRPPCVRCPAPCLRDRGRHGFWGACEGRARCLEFWSMPT
jgi:hypothetical protein